ncbi:hypothetical protein HYPSUDRAFT_64266 [Hypholoma sublateritium FD-334 SS-4]|uniref:Cytochrome P450 n=1 Tax=Hypholoma sublateritium (strain FD-334 SS-4) TaxID=945553 RepID=A0A0D2P568_HYPSF|nr:hypothetical protein HYPSUDRAFT_64266 [Hypholoma sublateritium FD-334 SS-4]
MVPAFSSSTWHSILLIGITSFVLNLWIKLNKNKNLPLPPGPKGYPVIGNMYGLPHRYPWLAYAEWKEKYGPVSSFTVLGKTTIILNSLQAAKDLLDNRSSNFSSRPRMVMADELLGWEWDFAHMPYNERWRKHRKMFFQYFQPKYISVFSPFQRKMAITLLDQFSASPADFIAHIRQYVGSVVLHAAYGHEVKSDNDFYIRSVQRAIEPLIHAIHATGSFLVEFMPALKHVPAWIPGASFKRHVETDSQKVRDLRDIPFKGVKASMADGSARRSFVSDNLDKTTPVSKEDEEVVRNCAAITAALITAWVLAMAHYPEIQKRAQEEIDQITGGSKLPGHDDIDTLPYLQAVLLETLRWHSVAPLALPHQALSEDEYNGHRIPAGATITVNAWAIFHDEEIYPDPFRFNPERFLHDGKISFDRQPDPTFAGGFGFGRRICPGRHLAMQSVRMVVSSILATYNISKALGADGVPIEPLIKATDGVVSHPEPFMAKITPRSKVSIQLIEDAKMDLFF